MEQPGYPVEFVELELIRWQKILSCFSLNVAKERCAIHDILGGGFKDFLLSPLFGEDSHFD